MMRDLQPDGRLGKPDAGRRARRSQKHHDFDEIEDEADRGDEQAAARRNEQRRRRDDQDVERRERRADAVRDVDDRGDDREVEDRLRVQEDRAERLSDIFPSRPADTTVITVDSAKTSDGDERAIGRDLRPAGDRGDEDRDGETHSTDVDPSDESPRIEN